MMVKFQNGRTVDAEIARTPDEQRTGMLKYAEPPPGAMLFPYERPTDVTFHCRGMLFPIDILMLVRVEE
jgi:uncharacterized membrane protein (UPF0127 family)